METSSLDLEREWKGKRVVLTPGRGWEDNEEGPDGKYAIVGGTVGVSHGMSFFYFYFYILAG